MTATAEASETAHDTATVLRREFALPRAVSVLAGALLALAFPQANAWCVAFIGLVPALLLISSAPSSREGAIRAWFAAFGFLVTAHYWLIPSTGPFIVFIAGLLGALWLPWGWLAWHLLSDRAGALHRLAAIVALPAGWVALEYLRSWQSLGGPWDLLGVSQWNERRTLALAAAGGVWAVSFMLVAVNVALVVAIAPRATMRARIAAVLAAVVFASLGPLYAASRTAPHTVRTVTVAGVQPGVIEDARVRLVDELTATRALAASRPDLIVWGETSIGGLDLATHPADLAALEQASAAARADLIVNIDAPHGAGGIYKSSEVIGPAGIVGRYDKMRLVPFGEYIPFRGALGWLASITRAAAQDRRRGTAQVVLQTGSLAVGPVVCFESAFPDMTRHLAADGANIIVVQSATTTFQGSWAPAQHASLAAVRAVETGRSVVHATLSGVSAAFDATGRQLLWMPTGRTGAYRAVVPVTDGTTPFVRYGDWVPALSIVLALAALALVGAGTRRGPVRPARPSVGTGSTPRRGRSPRTRRPR